MILENGWLTGAFNFAFALFSLIAAYTIFAHWKTVRLAGATRAFHFFLLGIYVWGSYNLISLLLLVFNPLMGLQGGAMESLSQFILNARWASEVIAFGFMLIGFVGLMSRFNEILGDLKKSADSLEVELDSQSVRESDLKHEVVAQRVSDRSRSEFLFKISHELRAPLNGVLGLTALLANTDLKTEQRKLLGSLERSAQGMLSRVNDLLNMLKLESGRVEVRSIPFNPVELASTSHALFAPLALEKGLTFSASNSETAEQNVVGDEKLIKQIITNLLSNAIKYTQTGSIQLISEVTTSNEGHLWLSYSVIDTGIGLAGEAVAKMSKTGAQGAAEDYGMGLSMCWKLAALMGGDMSVESELEKGSAFTARLRVQPAQESSEA